MNFEEMVKKAFENVNPKIHYPDWIAECVRRCEEVDEMVKAMNGSNEAGLRSTQMVAVIVQNYLIEHNYFN